MRSHPSSLVRLSSSSVSFRCRRAEAGQVFIDSSRPTLGAYDLTTMNRHPNTAAQETRLVSSLDEKKKSTSNQGQSKPRAARASGTKDSLVEQGHRNTRETNRGGRRRNALTAELQLRDTARHVQLTLLFSTAEREHLSWAPGHNQKHYKHYKQFVALFIQPTRSSKGDVCFRQAPGAAPDARKKKKKKAKRTQMSTFDHSRS